MPGLDRTGPMGMGSMTGRARGMCNTGAGYFTSKRTQPRLGLSRGRGYRNIYRSTGLPCWMRSGQAGSRASSFTAPDTKGQHLEFLKEKAAGLKKQMEEIESMIKGFEESN